MTYLRERDGDFGGSIGERVCNANVALDGLQRSGYGVREEPCVNIFEGASGEQLSFAAAAFGGHAEGSHAARLIGVPYIVCYDEEYYDGSGSQVIAASVADAWLGVIFGVEDYKTASEAVDAFE